MHWTARRILSWLLVMLLVSTNLLDLSLTYAKEQKAERGEKIHQIKSELKYREFEASMKDDDADKAARKLTAVKSSLKKNGNYRLLLKTSNDLESVSEFFSNLAGSDAIVSEIADGVYELKAKEGSDFGSELLSELDRGKIPEKLGGYEVVVPVAMESYQAEGYLSGEILEDLWWVTKVGADTYQEELNSLPKVQVGVIDSGVMADHADLATKVNVSDAYDFVEEDNVPQDGNGHGTFVAGIIASKVNGKWVFGVNSNAEIIPLKVLDDHGVGSTYDLAKAIRYASDKGIRVLNVSLGGTGDPATDPVCQAITNAKKAGTVTVVSAGNSNSDVSNVVPAGCADAITVGAVDKDGNKASFSNFGSNVAISAPGVEIKSSWNDGGYKTIAGTSAASAFVAGAVSAVLAKDQTVTPDDIRNRIAALDYVLDMKKLLSQTGAVLSEVTAVTDNGTVSTSSGATGTWYVAPPPLPPQDPGLYYSGSFLYNDTWYGNSYYTGVAFPEDVLQKFGVQVLKEKPANSTGAVSAMSVPTSGLLGEWLLNGNTNDTSGNGNNGTAYSVTYPSDSRFWTVGSFNGAGGRVSLPTGLEAGTYFSVATWVNFTESQSVETYALGKYNSSSNAWLLGKRVSASSDFGFQVRTSAGVIANATTTKNFNDGQWHLVVGVKNGTNLYLYVDGILEGTWNHPSLTYTNWGSSAYIGSHTNASSGTWNGKIARSRIYNRALTLADIQSLYQESATQTNTSANIPTFSIYGSALSAQYGSLFSITQTNNSLSLAGTRTPNLKVQNRNGTKNHRNNEGDPVVLSTGEFSYDNTFMSVPGNKLPYEFTLNYRNKFSYDGPVGNNFDHNYNMYLVENQDGSVNFYNGKLGVFTFVQSGSAYAYDKGLKANLSKSGSLYTIVFDDGKKYSFGSNLKVSKIADRYGNSISFAYDADKKLTAVTDTLGRNFTYTYNADTRLQKVTDFSGRTVELAYYASGDANGSANDLKTVTIKSGTGTKTVSFAYTGSHNIRTLTDAKGQIYVTNTYDGNGRVTNQLNGSGSISYVYVLSGSSVYTNTVTNANGIVTKYTYDQNGNNTRREIFDSTGSLSTVYLNEYDSNARLAKTIFPRWNGKTYKYDVRGNVIEEREKADPNVPDGSDDIVTAYQYDGIFDVPVQITYPNGLVKDFVLDGSGNILSETSTGILHADGTTYGKIISYEYSTAGLLSKKTDAEWNVANYSYLSGQLASLVRWTGATTITETFAYDPYGNLVSSTDGEGKIQQFSYTEFNLTASGKTAEGIETRYTYDTNNNKTHEEKYLSGSTVGKIDYEYDILDRVNKKTEWYSATGAKITMMTYDGNGNLATIQEGSGALVKYKYDEMDRMKEKRVIVDPSDASKDIVTTYVYDRNGNQTSVTDPRWYVTSMVYDLYDRLTKKTDPTGAYIAYVYDKAGNVTETKAYNASNVLLQKTGAEYDQLGQALRTTRYDLTNVTPANIVETVEYDRNGKVVRKTDAKWNATLNTYDSFGRLKDVTDALGNVVTSTYDKRSLVTSKTVTSSGSAYTNSTMYAYDNDGRLVTETDANGKTKTYAYDALGNVTTSTDENGHPTVRSYDQLGRLLSETKTLTGATNQNVTTFYAYDAVGNLLSVTDVKGNVTTYQYDNLNRKTKEILPDGKSSTYSYDKVGNVVSYVNPESQSKSTTYDTLNRPALVTYSPGISWTRTETYSYDALWRMINGTNYWWFFTSSSHFEDQFTYDSFDRLISETQTFSGQAPVSVSYSYDLNGNRTHIMTGTGYITTYYHDALNRLTSLSYNSGSVANYVYSGTLLDAISFGNGMSAKYGYDALFNLNSLVYSNGSGSLLARAYVYDPASNVLSDGQRSYVYDSVDRLTAVSALSGVTVPATSEFFSYDLMGNRISNSINNISKTYSGNVLNQYLSVTQSGASGSTYSYDGNWNVISNGILNFSYDTKGRLIEIKKTYDGSYVAKYFYDVLGRRIQKVTPGVQTDYVYAGDNAIIQIDTDLATWAKTVTNRVYGNGTDDLLAYETDDTVLSDEENEERAFCQTRITPYASDFSKYGWNAMVARCDDLQTQYATKARKLYYVQKDRLGSTLAIADASGSTVQSYAYDAFGTPYVASGTGYVALKDFAGNLHGNDRFFTGREYDRETGLHYYRARYYDSDLGRFMGRDPIGMADQVNLYAYVANNPLKFTDPTGKEKEVIAWIFKNSISTFSRLKNLGIFDKKDEWTRLNVNDYDLVNFLKPNKGAILSGDPNFNRNHVVGGNILIGGNYYNLGEVSNILVWFNAYNAWYSMSTLQAWAMAYTINAEAKWNQSDSNGVMWEYLDSELYSAGYNLAKSIQGDASNLTTDMVVNAIGQWTDNRLQSSQNPTVTDYLGAWSLEVANTTWWAATKLNSYSSNFSNYIYDQIR